jgi:hypothetical protein
MAVIFLFMSLLKDKVHITGNLISFIKSFNIAILIHNYL